VDRFFLSWKNPRGI